MRQAFVVSRGPKIVEPAQVASLTESGECLRRSAVGEVLVVECEPDAFAYRLLAE